MKKYLIIILVFGIILLAGNGGMSFSLQSSVSYLLN